MTEDVDATFTDSPSVMVKFGHLSPAEHQLCFAHGVQLAVNDVLYAKPNLHQEEELVSDHVSDVEVSSDDDDIYLRKEKNQQSFDDIENSKLEDSEKELDS